MKGMFYSAKESPRSDICEFQPYHLGPVSFEIYRDLDELVREGYVVAEYMPRSLGHQSVISNGYGAWGIAVS